MPSSQLDTQPHDGNASLKRKCEDDHESSRTQPVGRFSSTELVVNAPQDEGSLEEDSSEEDEPEDESQEDGPEEEPEEDKSRGRCESKEKDESKGEGDLKGQSGIPSDTSEAPSHWQAIISFHDMIKDPTSAGQKYTTLDEEQKLIIALGVRNLFLATNKSGSVRDRDRQILEHMQCVLGDVSNPAVIRDSGLRVSFYPGRKYTKLRYFQDLDAKIGEHPHTSYFAQLSKSPRVFAAFVEAQE
ncbi:hypothetical protein E4U60_006683 [Claviceps pazoutovae]|uniref:Uncharacterized protein n=1 Tax=Claviceps pazoutovae TaxID=1649127 RepID=A0A9P7SJG2_9HYPO|nr:hypothetical protein E4U60_006683 [Claviceps pazoutovae]